MGLILDPHEGETIYDPACGTGDLFLHGIKDFQIYRRDALRNPAFFEADGLKTFDCVIANPHNKYI